MAGLLERLRDSMNRPGLGPLASEATPDIKDQLRGKYDPDTPAGVYVTEETARKLSVVYRCVRLISDTIATVPAKVYRRIGEDARREDREHPIGKLFRRRPNPWQTGLELRAWGQESLLQKGRAYWLRVPLGRGRLELMPIEKERVTEERHLGGTRYKILPDSTSPVLPRGGELENNSIFRIMAPGGKGVLENARDAANLTYSQDIFAARVYGKGGNFSGTLETDQKIGPAERVSLEDSFNKSNAGLHKSSRILLLPRGFKFTKMSMTANEAELIESRRFQVEDLARFYGVPPAMLGSTGALPRSNVEQSFREFLMMGLAPWLILWETQINLDLFGDDEESFFEFDVDGLLRGDLKNRFEAYRIALGGQPFMTTNEVRKRQNLNPVPGGDKLKEPVNMQGADGRKPPAGSGAEPEEDEADAA